MCDGDVFMLKDSDWKEGVEFTVNDNSMVGVWYKEYVDEEALVVTTFDVDATVE